MLTQPAELDDSMVADALARHWRITVDHIEYRAVGFGSHHWGAVAGDTRWFVTVDDLDTKLRADDDTRPRALARLRGALGTARLLRDHGLSFVIAPIVTSRGEAVELIDERFAVAVSPHVDGQARSWGPYESRADRVAVMEMIAAVHDAPQSAARTARPDDFTIQNRDDLVRAIETGTTWRAGPYSQQAGLSYAQHADVIGRLLDQHDRLAAEAHDRPDRCVVTHGEPHPGNTMATIDGTVLVDWDTAMLAPPERDLWMVAKDDPSIIDLYAETTGRNVLSSMLEMYRITWDLADLGVYAALLGRPHDDTDDLRQSMSNVDGLLDSLA